MKPFRAGNIGQERPCAVDGNGIARDVSALIGDFTPIRWARSPRGLAASI